MHASAAPAARGGVLGSEMGRRRPAAGRGGPPLNRLTRACVLPWTRARGSCAGGVRTGAFRRLAFRAMPQPSPAQLRSGGGRPGRRRADRGVGADVADEVVGLAAAPETLQLHEE